jgi:localization factor PodJL
MTAPDSVPAAHVRAAAPAVIQEGESATAADLAQPAAINPAESLAAPASGQQALGTSRMALPDMMVGPLSLRLAAANGDASAQFEVAARYAEGRGVRQDFKEAVRWYQHSAAASFALSQYRLGTLYERGLGVDKDLARARVWYGRAAAQGNVKAMHNLAVLAAGNSAGQPDYITAAQWFTAAAEHGLADSQFNLAILYQHGLGVAQDETRAYRWFSLAALSGDGEAKKRKAEAAKSLKLDQVAELDRAIAEWQRRPVSKLANDPHVAGQHWQRSAS